MSDEHLDPDEPTPASSPFAEALEEFERGKRPAEAAARAASEPAPGARLRGKVVAISDQHALIDVGARSEAVADLQHFRNEDGSLRIAVGDVLELFVIEAGDSLILAPSARVDPRAGLAPMREAKQAGMPVSGRVVKLNAGGLKIDLGGVQGFCPVSQIELGFCAEPSVYVGRTLEFLVTAIEDARRSVVVSRRQLLQREEREVAQRRLATLKPGDELDGVVKNLESFGAFVDLGGIEGLVHVSEIRHGRVAHPRDALEVGQKVRVRVLRLETGKDGRPRVALSTKASSPDPWEGAAQRWTPGTRVPGVVARIADFGAFVTLEPGIDGLVHVSEIAGHRVERVKDALAVGQQIEAVILAVDPKKRRISLSIRAATQGLAEPEPVATKETRASAVPEAKPTPKNEEPTTMALAFRKAAERARQKGR
jgi:small subunit ribosomal protein S1